MSHAAVKGGEDAIENASTLLEYFRTKAKSRPIALEQVSAQLRLAADRAMGEGALYAPEHAALALLQVEGDSFEAALHLRAYRATVERRYTSDVLDTREMFVHRRISSNFRDIPGGQILGPTRDYSVRLLNPSMLNATLGSIEAFLERLRDRLDPEKLRDVRTYGKVIDLFVREGLMRGGARPGDDRRVVDVTREAIKFPAPRSAVLQMLARAETGALMCMAYSVNRTYGDHDTVGELRVGEVPVRVVDARGRRRYVGKIKVTECEMIGTIKVEKKSGIPHLQVGYGLCFGQNETKAISMGMVDRALRTPDPSNPAKSQEFVLYHTECIESYGFTNHVKLPHYVTFQADLHLLREIIEREKEPAPTTGSRAAY